MIYRNFLLPIIGFLLICQSALCAPKIDPQIEKTMWDSAWTRFFSPKTCIFYDLITSYDPQESLDFVPTHAQIEKLSKINPNGYGTGMEDGMIIGGIMMCAVLDKYEVTKDKSLKKYATAILQGMKNCALIPNLRGFVARALSVSDGASFFPSTSRDQYTHCVHGLWKFYNSPLADTEDKEAINEICTAIAERMIAKVTQKNNYDALNADDTPSTFGLSKMWNVAAHEAARLPMIYAIAWRVSGNEKYRIEYEKYVKDAVSQSENFSQHTAPWALLQMQVSLEALRDFAQTSAERNKIDSTTKAVATLAAKRLGEATAQTTDPRLDLKILLPNPQERTRIKNGKPDMREFEKVLRAPRYFGEMALTMLVCGAEVFDTAHAAMLAKAINQINYDKMSSCAVMFHLATYWSAKKHRLIE